MGANAEPLSICGFVAVSTSRINTHTTPAHQSLEINTRIHISSIRIDVRCGVQPYASARFLAFVSLCCCDRKGIVTFWKEFLGDPIYSEYSGIWIVLNVSPEDPVSCGTNIQHDSYFSRDSHRQIWALTNFQKEAQKPEIGCEALESLEDVNT